MAKKTKADLLLHWKKKIMCLKIYYILFFFSISLTKFEIFGRILLEYKIINYLCRYL